MAYLDVLDTEYGGGFETDTVVVLVLTLDDEAELAQQLVPSSIKAPRSSRKTLAMRLVKKQRLM